MLWFDVDSERLVRNNLAALVLAIFVSRELVAIKHEFFNILCIANLLCTQVSLTDILVR